MTETHRRACFHRYATFKCGCIEPTCRDNAEQIDCPKCAGTARKLSFQSADRYVGGTRIDRAGNILGQYSEEDRRFARDCGERTTWVPRTDENDVGFSFTTPTTRSRVRSEKWRRKSPSLEEFIRMFPTPTVSRVHWSCRHELPNWQDVVSVFEQTRSA